MKATFFTVIYWDSTLFYAGAKEIAPIFLVNKPFILEEF